MGVHLLTSFLKNLKKNGSYKVSLNTLSGKRIVVDASIYLYRFKAMDALIENIYLLCTLFRVNNISALFVFDGKSTKNMPPNEFLGNMLLNILKINHIYIYQPVIFTKLV